MNKGQIRKNAAKQANAPRAHNIHIQLTKRNNENEASARKWVKAKKRPRNNKAKIDGLFRASEQTMRQAVATNCGVWT